MFDENKDKTISMIEFVKIMTRTCKGAAAGFSMAEAKDKFHEVDSNSDGRIKYEEFVKKWTTAITTAG